MNEKAKLGEMLGNIRIIAAIDGPAGAGKTTVAKECAKRLGLRYIDTGALYRAVALHIFENNLNAGPAGPGPDGIRILDPGPGMLHALFKSKEADIPAMLPDIDVKLETGADGGQAVILNGKDVTGLIRTYEISMLASHVSAMPEVRSFLLDIQRNMAGDASVVMEGRDIGTVVFPNADIKIFLTADLETRAKRRYMQMHPDADLSAIDAFDIKDIVEGIEKRDKQDSERAAAPLRPADGAVIINSSPMSLEQVTDEVSSLIEKTALRKLSDEAYGKHD